MKKRFFTFLMAILALLSISQVVKAADCYIMGSFNTTEAWTKLDGQNMTALSGEKYTQEYKCTTSGEYRFRFAVGGESWQLCPHTPKYNLTEAIPNYGCAYTTDNGKGDNYFYVNMESGKTYTFTFDNSNASNRNVACTVSGSTSPSEFEKLYLIGGLYGVWKDDTTRPFTTTDGKVYEYVFDSDYTNKFNKESDDYYFRVKTATSQHYQPQTNDAPVKTEFTSANSGSSIAWKFTMTKGKSYTLIFDYKNKRIKYLEGVSKKIQLLNGSTEVTGSNGKYTLDLSSATSDATITLNIGGAHYGLTTAKTIDAVGTTSGIAFTTEGAKALTLKAGLIYSLTVTEDGKMTVEAEEKVNPVITADAGYYLVGNFFSKHNIDGGDPEDEINYSRLYFKFKDNGIVDHVHTYSMDIPASISAYMQILSVDDNNVKVVYGPGEIKAVSAATLNTNTSLTGTTLLKSSDLSKGGNYWSLTTRNDGTHDDDGMYTISFTESNGVPTNWTITHNAFKRVSYLISCAEGASAQPLYNKRGADELTSSFTDETKEYVHFDGNSQYYAISNVVFSRDDNGTEQNPQPMFVAQKIDNSVHVLKGHDSRPTHSKLFLLGNGGEEYSTANNYNKLSPNENAIKFSLKGTYFVRINPSQGYREIAIENDHYGINVDIYTGTGTPDYPDAISMVGPAIASTTTTVGDKTTWNWASTAGDMTYDENDRCYKLVLNTTDDMVGKTFRFVGDHAITQNWYEDQTKANIQYPTTQGEFSDATVADPNYVNYTNDCTEENIEHENDILWNRGAGLWTVRFYIDKSQTGDNAVFYYTITGASKIYIPVTAHMGKLLRTYTSAVDVVPVDANVLIYAAQSYTKKNENNTGSGDETGTVKLYRLKYIPANQGVVLYSPNSPLGNGTPTKLEVVPANSETVKRYSNNAYDYIEDWAESAAKKSMWVNTHENETWNNFLVPVLTDTNITQFYFDDQNNWTGRNFAFTRYSQTKTGHANGVITDNTTDIDPKKHDYFSFFRAAGTVKASYSYLMLPLTIMEGNGQILDQNQDNDTKLFSKSMVWFEGIDAPMDNETTGITELKNHVSNTDAAYYTLQGVKVAKPVKGIYIHQGKKVIVK